MSLPQDRLMKIFDLVFGSGLLLDSMVADVSNCISYFTETYEADDYSFYSGSFDASKVYVNWIDRKNKVVIEIIVHDKDQNEHGFIRITIDTSKTEYYISELDVSHMFVIVYPPQKIQPILNHVLVRRRP